MSDQLQHRDRSIHCITVVMMIVIMAFITIAALPGCDQVGDSSSAKDGKPVQAHVKKKPAAKDHTLPSNVEANANNPNSENKNKSKDSIERGDALLVFRGHAMGARNVLWSPDGKRIISGSDDKTIKVWDAEKSGDALFTLTGHAWGVYYLALSADGQRLVSASMDKTVKIWNATEPGDALFTLQAHKAPVYGIALSADGKRIVTGSYDQSVKVWNVNTADNGGINGSIKGGLKVNEKPSLNLDGRDSHTESVYCVAISKDGKRIVSASYDKTIKVWDAEQVGRGRSGGGPPLFTLEGHEGAVHSIALSADGKRIASGSYDKTVKLWDAEKAGPALQTFRGHTGRVYSVAISADGKRIVSGSDDKTIKIWDAEQQEQPRQAGQGGEALRTLKGHKWAVLSVALSPDGKRIASGSMDKTVRVWSVE